MRGLSDTPLQIEVGRHRYIEPILSDAPCIFLSCEWMTMLCDQQLWRHIQETRFSKGSWLNSFHVESSKSNISCTWFTTTLEHMGQYWVLFGKEVLKILFYANRKIWHSVEWTSCYFLTALTSQSPKLFSSNKNMELQMISEFLQITFLYILNNLAKLIYVGPASQYLL